MTNTNRHKILIFDSGVGGLSVYQQIQKRLPQLDVIYFFDNEAYPYGELSQDVLIDRVELFVTDLVKKEQIDLVVIACNTASTIVLPRLRAQLTIPVVGVVPAIKPASLLANVAVGLIATPATVTRQYTHDLIQHFSQDKKVELLGSTRLVDMAEEKLRGQAIDLQELSEILQPLIGLIDVAVLGCTHFPLIKDEIQTVLGSNVTLVDSGEAIARRVESLLFQNEGIPHTSSLYQPLNKILSSAPPWKEGALNERLSLLGFSPIQTYPLHLDV
ncbi:glutamate racemase [Vibrio porteresiae]|uniref:Glutamate racemase n=1 Tax=Vibrio porteresiae DSM 19223 TaxID=1123496 RepID=A0ABZ0QC13_9VIBR|nr:glutamate racemase [Vibrio porteresiae]WPC73993.1 glutamate racemase [Vibrio porteresiae DSM 19223]